MLQTAWEKLARRTRWQITLGWIGVRLSRLGPAWALGMAAGTLWGRSVGVRPAVLGAVWAVSGLAVVVWAVRVPRVPWHDVWGRLDARYGFRGALYAALEGIVPWPPLPPNPESGLRWRKSAVLGPFGLILGLLALAFFWPMRAPSRRALPVVQVPASWEATKAALEVLEPPEAPLDPEAVERWRETLAALEAQKPEEWLSEGSLEAGDHLARGLRHALDGTEAELAQLERALEEALAAQGGAQGADRARLAETAKKALAGHSLSPELAKKMERLANGQDLNSEALRDLKRAIEQGRRLGQAARRALARGEGRGQPQPGQGDVQRGPGTVPLQFSQAPVELGGGQEGLPFDPSRAVRADVVREDGIAPEASEGYGRAEGGVGARGRGGEATWKLMLPPEEQERLRRYFE